MDTIDLTIDSPKGRQEIRVRKGLGFQAIALKHNISIDFDCRKADCGVCIFKVISGEQNLSRPSKKELDFLKAMRADKDERLACQVCILGNAQIKIEY